MDQSEEWLELSVEASPESVEAVSDVLARYGHQGGVVIEEAQLPADDGVSLKRDPTGSAVLRTYIRRQGDTQEKLKWVQVALDLLGELSPIGPVQVRVLAEEDWAHAWKAHYPVLHVGERMVVVPAWHDYQPQAGELVLTMDPGMAFGTGLHPTTQLCLRALERYARPNWCVLDLGTGSGILAIAAAKMGHDPVLALDTDPLAVRAARENIERNQLGHRIEVREGTLRGEMGPFDLILANLLARTLRGMAGLLAASLAAKGVLVASGVLEGQADEVTVALAAAGLQPVERLQEGEWVALVASRGEEDASFLSRA